MSDRWRRASELTPKELGQVGEHVCARWLERRGCEVIECNWRCMRGEVDIIADDDGARLFVEVKTRLALDGRRVVPELAVDERKIARYRDMALIYLAENPEVENVRFDVAGISVVAERCAHVHYIEGLWLGTL